jgi:hypothetical protein
MSFSDKHLVRSLDPMARPSYMREPTGAVWIYECDDEECDERIINASDSYGPIEINWPW